MRFSHSVGWSPTAKLCGAYAGLKAKVSSNYFCFILVWGGLVGFFGWFVVLFFLLQFPTQGCK